MTAPIATSRDALAEWFCAERHDCAKDWADCDHGFGYRDADTLLASGVIHTADTLVRDRAWAEAFLREWSRPYFGDDASDAVAAVLCAASVADVAALGGEDD